MSVTVRDIFQSQKLLKHLNEATGMSFMHKLHRFFYKKFQIQSAVKGTTRLYI